MSYSIIKSTWKCDPITKNKIGDEIEIIETHDRYMRAIEHFKEIVNYDRSLMRLEGSIESKEYSLGNDMFVQITGDNYITDFIFTENYMKYI